MHMPGWKHELWQLWNGVVPMPTHIFYSGHKKSIPGSFCSLRICFIKTSKLQMSTEPGSLQGRPFPAQSADAVLPWEAPGRGLCRAPQVPRPCLPPLPSLRTHKKLKGEKERIFPFSFWAAPVASRHGWMFRQGTDDSSIFSALAWHSWPQAGGLWGSSGRAGPTPAAPVMEDLYCSAKSVLWH